MNELEKQALEDPFLAEAMEGYEQADISAGRHLSLLQRQLEGRIAQQQEEKKVFYFTWQRLSVAAAAGLLFISAGILFWMKGYNRHENQIASKEKRVEVKLTPHDSLGLSHNVAVPSFEKEGDQNLSAKADPSSIKLKGGKEPARYKSLQVVPDAEADKVSVTPVSKDTVSPALLNENRVAEIEVISAQPVSGWDKYREYLQNNIVLPDNKLKHGRVVVGFTIDSLGRPADFRIIKGLNEDCNNEAIRLIKEGPAWNHAPSAKNTEARVTVRFGK